MELKTRQINIIIILLILTLISSCKNANVDEKRPTNNSDILGSLWLPDVEWEYKGKNCSLIDINQRDYCYLGQSRIFNYYCFKIVNSHTRDVCFWGIAIENNNTLFCEYMSNNSNDIITNKEMCFKLTKN